MNMADSMKPTLYACVRAYRAHHHTLAYPPPNRERPPIYIKQSKKKPV